MFRGAFGIAALAAGVLLGVGHAVMATPPIEDRPYMYLWAAPGATNGGWAPVTNYASMIVRGCSRPLQRGRCTAVDLHVH